jgi:hypothetical protein
MFVINAKQGYRRGQKKEAGMAERGALFYRGASERPIGQREIIVC